MLSFRSLTRVFCAAALCGACQTPREQPVHAARASAPHVDAAPAQAPSVDAPSAASPAANAEHVSPWTGTHELATHVGTYLLRWRATPALLPLAQNFALDVWVFDARAPDVALADVTVDVDAGMPQHGHGLARRPRIARVEPGHWRAEGLRFHMPGRWELYFDVTRGARLERAQTSVVLE